MKEKTVKVVLLLRQDSLENWQRNNPILRTGEMSYVTDLGRCKVGDGVHHWLDLPFFALETDFYNTASIIIKTNKNWEDYDRVVSKQGTIYVYTEDNLNVDAAPKMKIGDGSAYICDLPFITDDLQREIENHIANEEVHTTLSEKQFWNNKINVIDREGGVVDNVLIFNRN